MFHCRFGILTRVFLERGANVNIGDNAGVYPFHLVENSTYPEVQIILLYKSMHTNVPCVADSSFSTSAHEEGRCCKTRTWFLSLCFFTQLIFIRDMMPQITW